MKKDKIKIKELESLRADIEHKFDRMDIAWDQIGDHNSELFVAIGAAAGVAHSLWDHAQEHIDNYDRSKLIVHCERMVKVLATLHTLTEEYRDVKDHSPGSKTLDKGWRSLHDFLSFLADELDIQEGGSKCWPPGSEC